MPDTTSIKVDFEKRTVLLWMPFFGAKAESKEGLKELVDFATTLQDIKSEFFVDICCEVQGLTIQTYLLIDYGHLLVPAVWAESAINMLGEEIGQQVAGQIIEEAVKSCYKEVQSGIASIVSNLRKGDKNG